MNFSLPIKLPKSVGGKKNKELKIEIFNYLYIICSVTYVDFHAIALVCYLFELLFLKTLLKNGEKLSCILPLIKTKCKLKARE
jgi:hypothetical protein